MRTTAGRDWQAGVMGNPSANGAGAFAPACYLGFSADGTAPTNLDTVLTGEVTTGTLARVQATYAHTVGTPSYTLTKTLTFDQNIILVKFGVFTLSSAGVLFDADFLDDPISGVIGDTVTVTITVTL